MKKLISSLLIMAIMAVIIPGKIAAQGMPPVPVDTAVIVGKLPNGLTYYIRKNSFPKGQAEFYIAQKVGSILEEDNQRGLAHFLEHMCFNGTKNFPGNQVVSWLESIGVKFGANLNAYTGVDETIYN
ncbi:MAG: insulinase family protein, partial [Muribaculaceae bacterium]|nr:insulinase family protein [Muribaculaceae bacterium]